MHKVISLSVLLSALTCSPALSQEVTLAESSPPVVATSDAVINTSESINLPKGQEKLQLFLTYYNGDKSAPKFSVLRVSSSSLPYLTEQSFGKRESLTTNVTGDLGWGGNQILISAKGPKGAMFGWRLTTPKPTITSISPQTLAAGGTVAINGTNLCPEADENQVQIGGKSAKVISATATQIVARVPENVQGGSAQIVVKVAGLDAGQFGTQVDAVPVLSNLNPTWAWMDAPVTINGEGFGNNKANVVVYMGWLQAQVDSVTPTQIVMRVPEGFGPTGRGFNQPVRVIVNGVKSRNTLILSTGDQEAP